MIRMSLFLIAGALSLACCSYVKGADVVGSGKQASETRSVATYSKIVASSAFRLDVQCGSPTATVVVEGDDNIVPLFVTEVSNGTLGLRLPNGSFHVKTPLVVRVTGPNVESVKASGAIDTTIDGLAGPRFDADLSGSCQLRATGKVDEFDVSASGAIRLDAFELVAQDVTLDLSGSSRGDVNATRALEVKASGASTVRYRGKPQLKSSVSGSSTIAAD